MSKIPDKLRQQARDRANKRCEYCRLPEDVRFYTFHADHIIGLKHTGRAALDNLAWACFDYNVAKGTDIASIDSETQTLTSLYNPRTEIWDEHFLMEYAVMIGKTAVGRVTINIMQMNHPDRIILRKILIDSGLW